MVGAFSGHCRALTAVLPDGDPHGDCPLPALPLDHPDHHPPPPVRPQHALNLLVSEPEDDADHETLCSYHGHTSILELQTISKSQRREPRQGAPTRALDS